jgi:hypothetical protein
MCGNGCGRQRPGYDSDAAIAQLETMSAMAVITPPQIQRGRAETAYKKPHVSIVSLKV